jgi:hypothetical protein
LRVKKQGNKNSNNRTEKNIREGSLVLGRYKNNKSWLQLALKKDKFSDSSGK